MFHVNTPHRPAAPRACPRRPPPAPAARPATAADAAAGSPSSARSSPLRRWDSAPSWCRPFGRREPGQRDPSVRRAAPDTFSASTLETQVAGLLAKARRLPLPAPAWASRATEPGQSAAVLRTSHRSPVRPEGHRTRRRRALATEEGTYKGTDAVLVVLPDASDSTRVNAYIVDTACVNHPSSGPARVLLTHLTSAPDDSTLQPVPRGTPLASRTASSLRVPGHSGNARPLGSVGWGESPERLPRSTDAVQRRGNKP